MNSNNCKVNLFFESRKEQTIGDIAIDIYKGHAFATKYKGTGDFPAIISRDLRNADNIYLSECQTFINKDFVRGKLCTNGDILVIHESMSKDMIGKFFLYDGKKDCIVAQEIFIIKHNQNPKYLIHALNSDKVKRQIKRISQQKVESEIRSRIKVPHLVKIKIPIPPLEIQEKIAEYLDNLLILKNTVNKNLELLLEKRRKQYEYYKELLLNGGIDRWDIISLSEIATDMFGGSQVSNEQLGTGNYPTIKCGDVNSGLDKTFYECISFVDESLIQNKKYFEHGDILIGQIAHCKEVAGSAVAYLGKEKCILGNSVYVLRHEQNPSYLAYVLSSKFCRKQIESMCLTGALCSFSMKSARKIQIPLPPLEEQEKIVFVLDNYTKLLNKLEKNINLIMQSKQKQYVYFSNLLISEK